MSIETLVLVVFLVVLPLLERLVRALRERTAQGQDAPLASLPHSEPAPAAASLPATVPQQPAPRHLPAERVSASERVRASRVIQQAAVAPVHARPATRPRRHPLLLSNRAELRRAVVLMTILGPCKAVEGETSVRAR
jgi:hypothetical protein